ncbi:MAG: prephenate dehydratase [Anaerolineae bacterium]|nr:prephenate dehydratase [Anaerolineae bacterium]
MIKVAFQGEPGAYSEAAVLEYFKNEAAPLPCESFDAVFEAVEKQKVSYGVIPIENSLAGSIHQNYDLLRQHNLHIVGEHFLRIQHCLIALPEAGLSDIRKVISHPQGLAQCDHNLRKLNHVKTEAVYDTAGAVKMLHDRGISTAAIASRRAAEVYHMQILIEGFEDNKANFTRFLVISPEAVNPGNNAKTSIVFALENKPGSLFKAMSVFALRDLDLTKIESRPLIGTPWDYLFYIDFIGSTEDPRVKKALDHLGEYSVMLRVLGSYPRYQF